MDKRGSLNENNGLSVGINDLATHAEGETDMRKTSLVLLLTLMALTTSACAPLLIGGAAVAVADEAVEQDQGGDGLF